MGLALSELQRTLGDTHFLGYGETQTAGEVKALMVGGRLVDSARAGEEVEAVLNATPFYAESGGQVGDSGYLTAPAGDTTCAVRVRIDDTQKVGGIYLHKGKVEEGEIHTGQPVKAAVDGERRAHIMRNHSATHLLHAALRQVLGSHVHQKGSLVAPDRLRFDFTHTQPMSPELIRKVEDIVNERVLADDPVAIHADIPISEAKARGAMALFGEKYGDKVRMIEIPGFSLELCGGTHLKHTSQIGLFKITSETGIAAGVRRIEAVTGAGAYQLVREREDSLNQLASLLKTHPRDVLVAAERLQSQRAMLEKQVLQLKSGAASGSASLKEEEVNGILVITGAVPNADADTLSGLADRTAQQRGSAVIALGAAADGKVSFVAKATPDLLKRGIHAGNLVREVAKIAGGGGGGRPDFAQAGGRDPGKLDDALAAVPDLVRRQTESAA
jgi:alanyl-tRNA synthetase